MILWGRMIVVIPRLPATDGSLMRALQPLVLLFSLMAAMPGFAGMPVIESGQVQELLVSPSLSILEDVKGQLDQDAILAGRHDDAFQPATGDFPGLNNPDALFWIKLSIHNKSSSPHDLILESRYPLLDALTLYQTLSDGTRGELLLGDEWDSGPRPMAFRYPAFPLRVEPGINHYVMKIRNKGKFVLSMFLWDSTSFQDYTRRDSLVLGLLYGSMFVLMLYNIFLMFSFKSQTYLVYVLYLVAFMGAQSTLQGTWYEWIGGTVAHWSMNRGWLILASLSHVFACLFALRFLNMQRYMPNWRRWIQFLIGVNLLVTVHGFFASYPLLGQEVTLTTILVSLTLIASGLVASWRGFRPAVYYTLAWSCLLLGNLVMTLMFNGLFPLNFFAQWGSLLGGAMEVALMSLALGSRVNHMQARSEKTIKDLNRELTHHIQEVESHVAERTQTIRSIVDHVKSGFFRINPQLQVEAGFTKACHHLLGPGMRDQACILDVLGLEGSRRSIFQMTVQQALDDSMPEDVGLAQIPKTFRLGERILNLEGGLIRDDQGRPRAILFTVSDMTRLHKKQREALRSAMLIKILKNMDAFKSFMKITRENLQHLADPEVRSKPKTVAFILHTLKGNCLIFNMKQQAHRIHKLEEAGALSLDDIQGLEQSFQLFLHRHADILSLNWDNEQDEDVVIKRSDLLNLRQQLNQPGLLREFLSGFDSWMRIAAARSARSLLGPIVDDVQQLARRSGRHVQFEVLGADVRIYSAGERHVIKNLVHLVRNAVIHGIDEDRSGKPACGNVMLMFRAEPGRLEIRCKDDGRGMDRGQLVRLIVEKGLAVPGAVDSSSISELIEILSREGFSTSKEIDLYSGRGVGVASVYGAIKACQGRMEIRTELGQGTEFIITLPRHEEQSIPDLKAI